MTPRPSQPGQTRPAPLPRRPEPIRQGGLMDPRRHGTEINRPDRFPDGRRIEARPIVRGPGREQIRYFDNDRFRGDRLRWEREEHERGRYYWHDWDNGRYCHYNDSFGFSWYGWYIGSAYFWTRYWNDMYWYYDPYWHRWVYMRDGRWWWQDPVRTEIVYVYVPEQQVYYRYDDAPSGGVVLTPDPTTPVDAPPAEPNQPAPPAAAKIFYSGDGTRSVQLFGDNNDAFLYDTAETPAFNPVYLASGVTEARFSQTSDDQPPQILLLTETKGSDGTVTKGFLLFDGNGNAMEFGNPAVQQPSQDPATPDEPPTPSQTLNLLRAMSL